MALSRVIIAIVVLILSVREVSAQSAANAIVSATITDVVGILSSDNNDKSFLNKSKPYEGDIAFIQLYKTSEVASFTVIGNYSYSITLPSTAILIKQEINKSHRADRVNILLHKVIRNYEKCIPYAVNKTQVSNTSFPITVHYN